MSRVALAPHDLLSVVTVGNPDDLERIHEPGVALVRWRRSIPEPQRAWLDALPAAKLPAARFKARLGASKRRCRRRSRRGASRRNRVATWW